MIGTTSGVYLGFWLIYLYIFLRDPLLRLKILITIH